MHAPKLPILYSGMPPVLACSIKDPITDSSPDETYFSMLVEVLRWNTQSAGSHFQTLKQDEHLDSRSLSEGLQQLRELSDSPLEDSLLL